MTQAVYFVNKFYNSYLHVFAVKTSFYLFFSSPSVTTLEDDIKDPRLPPLFFFYLVPILYNSSTFFLSIITRFKDNLSFTGSAE